MSTSTANLRVPFVAGRGTKCRPFVGTVRSPRATHNPPNSQQSPGEAQTRPNNNKRGTESRAWGRLASSSTHPKRVGIMNQVHTYLVPGAHNLWYDQLPGMLGCCRANAEFRISAAPKTRKPSRLRLPPTHTRLYFITAPLPCCASS